MEFIKGLKQLASLLNSANGKYREIQKVLKMARKMGFKVPKLNGFKKDLVDAVKAIARLVSATIEAFEAVSRVVSPVFSLLAAVGLV